MTASLAAIALVMASASTANSAPSAAKASAIEQTDTTPAGVTFVRTAGWSSSKTEKLAELLAPEGDLRLAVVDAGEAPSGEAAVVAAWALWVPERRLPSMLMTASPARNGWDEQQLAVYETDPSERKTVQAVAYRSGKAWTVILIDGSRATFDKRSAAVNLAIQSLSPKGYVRESFAGRKAYPLDRRRIETLKAFVADAMRELDVPGVAFALTTRKETIFSTGLGVRTVGSPVPVDADSEFLIASNTKGLTTLMLAKLVDEGKLRWDEPVTQAYPAFRLGSAETTGKVLIRHLVCACTGLPRKDMKILLNADLNAAAADTFAQLAATEPTSGFGEVFQYNNLLAAAAGYVGAMQVHPELPLDAAFYRSIDEKVFHPIGMTATTFDFGRAMAGNWARPHGFDIHGRAVPLLGAGMKLDYAFTRYGPAAGAWSTANDLIKYVRFELNEGKLDSGIQYVSAKNLLERRVPNVAVGENQTYGMGLQTNGSYGVAVVHHGGNVAGYKSDLFVIPEAGIGAVILTNSNNGTLLLGPFLRRLLELLYDGRQEAANEVLAAATRAKAELAREQERVSIVPDVEEVDKLADEYSNPELGRLVITRSGRSVTFAFPNFSSAAGTRKNEDGSSSFVLLEPAFRSFPLQPGSDAGRRSLTVRDGQHEYKFISKE